MCPEELLSYPYNRIRAEAGAQPAIWLQLVKGLGFKILPIAKLNCSMLFEEYLVLKKSKILIKQSSKLSEIQIIMFLCTKTMTSY